MPLRVPLVACVLVGCFAPPDLPLIEEVPIEGQPVPPCDAERDAVVACVLDGDTVDLGACGDGLGERVRMLGLDAPEIAHSDSEVADCWGDEAHAALEEIVGGRRVTLTFDQTCLDLYGRSLAYLWLVGDELDHLLDEDGIDDFLQPLDVGDDEQALLVNQWMVWQGHARVFDEAIFGRLRYQDRLDAAQRAAEREGRGLWGTCGTSG